MKNDFILWICSIIMFGMWGAVSGFILWIASTSEDFITSGSLAFVGFTMFSIGLRFMFTGKL